MVTMEPGLLAIDSSVTSLSSTLQMLLQAVARPQRNTHLRIIAATHQGANVMASAHAAYGWTSAG